MKLAFAKIVFMIAAAVSFSLEVRSSDLSDSAQARFDEASAALDRIEAGNGAEFAEGEIAVARKWIADGRAAIESGRVTESAEIAERLPHQLTLIGILVSTGGSASEAAKAEKEAFELEQRLKILKAKRDRLLLEVHGRKISNAHPPRRQVGQ